MKKQVTAVSRVLVAIISMGIARVVVAQTRNTTTDHAYSHRRPRPLLQYPTPLTQDQKDKLTTIRDQLPQDEKSRIKDEFGFQ